MSAEQTTLGEYIKVQGGFAFKSNDFNESGSFPVLKIKNIRFGTVDYSDTSFINEKIANETKDWCTQEGDILISMTGSGPNAPQSLVGRVARVWANEPKAWINQRVGRIVLIDEKSIDKDFIYYLLTMPSSQEFLVSNSSGSANQANISGKTIESLPCPKINYIQSKSIATILRCIDQKIILNTQINQTLEQIAQAIFKSWFVDFDPVKAKIAVLTEGGTHEQVELAAMSVISGKDETQLAQLKTQDADAYQQLAQTAALFPAAMQESELGEIPEGWATVGFSDIVSKYIDNRGKTPPTQKTGIPLLEVKHLPEGSVKPDLNTDKYVNEETYEGWFRAHLESEDLIMSTVGTIGRLCMVPPNTKITIAQNLLGLRFDRRKASPYFMYYQMNDFRFKNDVEARLVITVQASIKRKDLETIDLLSAPIELQNKFESLIKPLILSQHSNENLKLSEIRDALLPKLLAGELI